MYAEDDIDQGDRRESIYIYKATERREQIRSRVS